MERYSILANNVAEGKHVKVEKGGAQHRPLGNTTCDGVSLGFCCAKGNIFRSVREVGGEPV